MEDKECRICGQAINGAYMGGDRGPVHFGECHSKSFWLEKQEWHEAGDRTPEQCPVFRTYKGEHFVIGFEDSTEAFRGHSGNVFYILFDMGCFANKIIRTSNLSHQGEIPEWLDLAENARFVSAEMAKLLSMDPEIGMYKLSGYPNRENRCTEDLLVEITE